VLPPSKGNLRKCQPLESYIPEGDTVVLVFGIKVAVTSVLQSVVNTDMLVSEILKSARKENGNKWMYGLWVQERR